MKLKKLKGKGFIKGSLRTKMLLVLMLITLVPVGIFAAYSYNTLRNQLTEDIESRLADNARRIALDVDMMLNDRIVDITSWANMEVVRTAIEIGGGQAGANTFLDEFVKNSKNFDLMVVADKRGNCIASNLPHALGTSFADQAWFKDAMAGKRHVGDFKNDPELKSMAPSSVGWTLQIAMPVTIGKDVRGVLAGYVRWDAVNQIIQSLPVTRTGYTYMVDRSADMKLVGHKNKGLVGLTLAGTVINLPQLAETFAQNEHGLTIYQFKNKETNRDALRAIGYYRTEGFGEFKKNWVVASGAEYDDVFEILPKQQKWSLGITGGIFALLLLGAIFLSRMIARPIMEVSGAMLGIASDLDFTRQVNVRGSDEIARMAEAFNRLIGKLRETFGTLVDGNKQVATAVERVKLISVKIVGNAGEQTKRAQDVLKRIEVMGQTAGEVQANAQESQQSYDATVQSISELSMSVENIAQAAQSQATMVEESRDIIMMMGETAQQVNQRAALQREAVAETASATDQVSTLITDIASKATQADKQSETSYQAAVEGRKAVEQVVQGMQSIAESSEQITEIIEVISDIADQTNLLALNAAIEAARAGEHGRGFAVVAEEVRKLAERTAESTKEISGLIKNSGERVKEGANLANSSQKALGNIVDAVAQTAGLIKEIDASTSEQHKGIKQVSSVMERLQTLSSEISGLTAEQAKRRQRASDVIGEVHSLTQSISASTQEQVKNANQVMQDSLNANQRAANITNMTTAQRERSLALQQIINEMSNVATTNVQGAKVSQQSSENLAALMRHFNDLIAQFKIGDSAENGNGKAEAQEGSTGKAQQAVDAAESDKTQQAAAGSGNRQGNGKAQAAPGEPEAPFGGMMELNQHPADQVNPKE